MQKTLAVCLAAGLVAAASAEVVKFPACAWDDVRVVRDARRVRVVDPAGKEILSFNTEGGNFASQLVVSNAAERLVIDPRAAFDAGMVKLVFTSADIGLKPWCGQDCTLQNTFSADGTAKVRMYFEGHGSRHYYRSRDIAVKRRPRTFAMVQLVDADLKSLHLRWDVEQVRGPVAFHGARYGLASELPSSPEKPVVEPELLFHAPFDGSADAKFAKGVSAPVCAEHLSFAEGKRGQAVRLTRAAKSLLAYSAPSNLVPERGTVSLWFKREWPDRGRTAKGGEIWRDIFANPAPSGERIGSGQLWFWFYGPQLRADVSDDDDSYRTWGGTLEDDWTHLAVTWDEAGVRIFVNGRAPGGAGDGTSPMKKALAPQGELLTFGREVFQTFCVGCRGKGNQFDGLIDDLRIYSAPLTREQIRELYRREKVIEITATGVWAVAGKDAVIEAKATSPAGCDLSKLHWCLCDASGAVVTSWKQPVGKHAKRLKMNLPAGTYRLRATDGTWFYGDVPVNVLRRDNPYELADAKGDGRPVNLKLVQTLRLDRTPPSDRFRAVGPVAVKRLGATPYLEAGPKAGNRFALRFNLDTNAPLHCFEIDYPDDAVRTADIIIQDARRAGGDYTMRVGYAAGDEYRNTGRVLTHRCLYWTSAPEVALVAMTARDGAPAAIASVRVYRVEGGALPPAEIHEPPDPKPESGAKRFWRDLNRKEFSQPDARRHTPRRSVVLYYEDPAIGYDFAVPKSNGHEPGDLANLIDRTAALMKFTGENVLAYPGAWYHGLIGERYNPRNHAPDFLSAWYAKFDCEGLSIYPTINPNTMPVPEDLVTRESMSDGTLHDSPIAIHDTGKPNWGGWHDTPPNFNFHHPKVRHYIDDMIDALLDQGADHPSFRGVCLHVTRHCMLTFGDDVSGYNDYTVQAFAKAKGLKIPVSKKEPLRGKAYADWLRANAWEDWIQWRCDQVTAFYAQQARKLAERRSDLKLWINYMIPADVRHPDFQKPGFMERQHRACGLDRARLTKEIPNLILCQTMVPADYRFRAPSRYPSPSARDHQRVLDTLPGFYALLQGAKRPWVHQHDRYWESAIGRGTKKGTANSLSCDWLDECPWRVTTINPSGVNALRHFVEPLRYGDVLGVSKGGFLVGTYGMEDVLVPFVQAFRALPAVVFDDVGAATPDGVRLRQKTYEGQSWFYVVNTEAKPVRVTLEVPARTRDLARDERVGGLMGSSALDLALKPYEMRSYAAPEGLPRRLK